MNANADVRKLRHQITNPLRIGKIGVYAYAGNKCPSPIASIIPCVAPGPNPKPSALTINFFAPFIDIGRGDRNLTGLDTAC